jgi:hypothetical protein
MMNSKDFDMTDIKTEEIWADAEPVAKLKGIKTSCQNIIK